MYKKTQGLYAYMKWSGYFTGEAEMQVQHLRSAFSANGKVAHGMDSQTVHKITEPFIVDLTKNLERMVFLQDEAIVPAIFETQEKLVVRPAGAPRLRSPYSGESFLPVTAL